MDTLDNDENYEEPSGEAMEGLEKIQEARQALAESAKRIGLYMEDWSPLIAATKTDEGDEEIHGLAFSATFLVGDLALRDRVAEDEKSKFEIEIENIENEMKINAKLEAYERMKKLTADVDD